MKSFLWRIVYAAIAVVMFWLVFPLFMEVVGFSPGGPLLALMRICIGCIAVIYVIWGPPPAAPF